LTIKFTQHTRFPAVMPANSKVLVVPLLAAAPPAPLRLTPCGDDFAPHQWTLRHSKNLLSLAITQCYSVVKHRLSRLAARSALERFGQKHPLCPKFDARQHISDGRKQNAAAASDAQL